MTALIQLDATNQKILDILQRDARASIADIGRMVGRAESTVRERVAALEAHRVIRGYHASVDPKYLGYSVTAMLTGSPDLADGPALKDAMARIPNMRAAFVTTGEHPLVMNLVAPDLAALERILVDHVAPLRLDHVNTEIVVRELVEQRPLQAVPGAQIPPATTAAPRGDVHVALTSPLGGSR